MTVYRLRLSAPITDLVVEVDDQNCWRYADVAAARGATLGDDFLALLAALGRAGHPSGGLPTHTRYPNGVIDVLGGEILSVKPPFESVPGRIY